MPSTLGGSQDLMAAFRRSVANSLGYQPLNDLPQQDTGGGYRPSTPGQQFPSAPTSGGGNGLSPGGFTGLLPGAGHPNGANPPGAVPPSAPGTASPTPAAPAPGASFMPARYDPNTFTPAVPELGALGVNEEVIAKNPALAAYVASVRSQMTQAQTAAASQLERINAARDAQYGMWGDQNARFGDAGYGTQAQQLDQLRNQFSARGLSSSGEHVLQNTGLRQGEDNQRIAFETQQRTAAEQLKQALLSQYVQAQQQLAAQALAGGFALK